LQRKEVERKWRKKQSEEERNQERRRLKEGLENSD
jgi:hypothetical protein